MTKTMKKADRPFTLADQNVLVNKCLVRRERIHWKTMCRIFSSRPRRVALKLLKIRMHRAQAAHAGKCLIQFCEIHQLNEVWINSFGGMGYRLGQTNDDHVALPDARASRPQSIDPVILRLWRQGFTINEGELRTYDEKRNKEFLECIAKG